MKHYSLLLFLTLALSTNAFSQNILPNGSFETWSFMNGDPESWSRYLSEFVEKSDDAQSGDYSAALPMSQKLHYLQVANIPFVNGKTYTGYFYYKVTKGTITELSISFSYMPADAIFPETSFTKKIDEFVVGEWTKVDFSYDEEVGKTQSVRILARSSNEDAEILIDNVYIADADAVSVDDALIDVVTVLPNPASDYIYVSGIADKSNISICGLDGRIVKQATVMPGEEINVSSLSAGIYILSVDGTNKQAKVVIR